MVTPKTKRDPVYVRSEDTSIVGIIATYVSPGRFPCNEQVRKKVVRRGRPPAWSAGFSWCRLVMCDVYLVGEKRIHLLPLLTLTDSS